MLIKMRPYRSLQHKTKDRGRFRHIPLDYFEHGVCFSLKHKNKTESQRSFFFPLRKRSFGCFKRLKVTDCLGFYVTKNRPKGRRQGYFVACLQPPPPLRKNRRSGGFFPRTGAAVQYCSSPVKIAFGRVYCFHYTPSVLTRILPWGVPGPPLLRNRGPVRTLGGLSPHSKLSVTWSTYLIQYGGRGVYDSEEEFTM